MNEKAFKFSVEWTRSRFFCGIDVHKYELAVAIYSQDDSRSEFVKTTIFTTDEKGLERFWNFVKKYQPSGFAMEATGIYHHVIYKFLVRKRATVRWSFTITVVNPADASGIPGRQKNDKVDALHLAKYLSKDLLPNGQPIIEVLEDLKEIFRTAARIERDRTALKNRIKKTLDRAGIRPKRLDLNLQWTLELLMYFIDHDQSLGTSIKHIFEDEELLKPHRSKIAKNVQVFVPYLDSELTTPQRAIIRQDLVELEFKTARKALIAVEIDNAILSRPGLRKQAHDIASIPGISPYSALWILAEIGSIKHFPSRNKFLAYCGCVPRTVSSAGKVYSAHVSRHSNPFLRTIFYNAAVVLSNLTKARSHLKDFAVRTIERKAFYSVKLAYCVIGTKIAKIVYGVLSKGVSYEPYFEGRVRPQIPSDSLRFSVSDRATVRRARNSLRRVARIEGMEELNIYSEELVRQLDLALQGKKVTVI